MLTYNREKMVSHAIESILSQTYTDFEYVIVDNGSSDKSGEIADFFATRDSRIRVIHREKGSIGAGRNTALDAAKGDYIAFVDDDDYAEPDFLEFLMKLCIDDNADVSICGSSDKVFDQKIIMSAEESVIELMWRKKYNMAFPTKMFKADISKDLRFPENSTYDDIALMYKLLANANKVAYYGLPKYTFYRHENNSSAWTTNHKLINADILDEYLGVYRARTEWLSDRFPKSRNTFKYFEWSFMISMIEKISRLQLNGCEKQRDYMFNELRKERDKFLNCPEILDFEREWVLEYI